MNNNEKGKKNTIFLIFFLLLTIIVLFYLFSYVINFVKVEEYIYFWDYVAYWNKYIYLSSVIKNGVSFFIKTVVSSITLEDYNFLPVLFLQIVGFFSVSRLSYILAIFTLYFVPISFLNLFFLYFYKTDNNHKKWNYVVVMSIFTNFVLSPVLIAPILRGEPSSGGVLLILMCIYILFKSDFNNLLSIEKLVLCLCLSILPIFRRWYIYFDLAFFIALIPFLWISIKNNIFLTKVKFILLNYLLIVFGSVLLFLIFSGNLYKKFLEIGTTNIYSAYKYTNTINAIFSISNRIGLFYIFLFLISLIYFFLNKKYRKFSFFFFLLISVTVGLFLRTQNFAYHHYYLIEPIILISISLFLFFIKNKKVQYVLSSILIITNLFNFYTNLVNKNVSFPLLSIAKTFPLIQENLSTVENVVKKISTLDDLTAVYVIASSDSLTNPFNDDVVRNYCYNHYSGDLCSKIIAVNHVDARDGFPWQFFKANYFITTNPIMFHLNADTQRVIGVTSEYVTSSKKFTLISEFGNKSNKVFIFKLKEAFGSSDKKDLLNKFNIFYPNDINFEFKDKY